MSKGVLLFAFNNESVNYVKQAHFLAQRISKVLCLPTTVITDVDISTKYPQYAASFDNVVNCNAESLSKKRYNDGTMHKRYLNFKNLGRENSFDLSPYDETLVLDTDFIVANDCLLQCFEQNKNLLMYKDAVHVGMNKNLEEFDRISDTGVDFVWATAIFFRKTKENRVFFDLVKHVKENYWHYRSVFQFKSPVYRNDFAFSIALHIINGYQRGNFAGSLPGKKFFATDKDILVEIKDNRFKLLVEKTDRLGEYNAVTIQNSNVHVMNKFSLERAIDQP